MFVTTIRISKKFAAALFLLLLVLVWGVWNSSMFVFSPMAGRTQQSMPAAVQTAPPDAGLEPHTAQTVEQRLAKIKSKQELMEKNKRYPLLHPDVTTFQRVVEVVATGYYAGPESTGKKPGHPQYGITYSGVRVKQDILSTIAADPAVFPMGTILYIPGYGYGIVADTGSAIKGNKIDLYYETKEQIYKEWGKKTVNVFVVKEGDGKVTEDMLARWNDILTVPAAQQHVQLGL